MLPKNLGLLITAATLLAPLGAIAEQYQLTSLGTLPGGHYSLGAAINASGEVTGTADDQYFEKFAFRFSHGRMQALGALPGESLSASFGYGVDARGQVAGYSNYFDAAIGAVVARAVLSTNDGLQDLGTLSGGTASIAYGISANGQVAGWSGAADGNIHAFLYANGTMKDLGFLPGSVPYSEGYAVNDHGEVTGISSTAIPYAFHAFLYSQGVMHDLGALGTGAYSSGSGINASGEVTGWSESTTGGAAHAFLYSHGAMQDLGLLRGFSMSQGASINARGEVTGWVENGYSQHAFVYREGRMSDLNALISSDAAARYVLTDGEGINDAGQIVANGYAKTDPHRTPIAFLLTHEDPTIATTTTLVATPAVAQYGSTVEFNAVVAQSRGTVVPQGTVTFSRGEISIGSAPLNAAGAASLSLATLPRGRHTVTATYTGDALDVESTSSVVIVTIT